MNFKYMNHQNKSVLNIESSSNNNFDKSVKLTLSRNKTVSQTRNHKSTQHKLNSDSSKVLKSLKEGSSSKISTLKTHILQKRSKIK